MKTKLKSKVKNMNGDKTFFKIQERQSFSRFNKIHPVLERV